MKHRKIDTLAAVIILSVFFSATAYANSSWHWLTKTTPFDILPYVVVLTLFIEYIMMKNLNSINRPFRLFIIVCFANLVSFLLPYGVLLIPSDVGYTFEMSLKHLPQYTVGAGYLFLTLVAEVPIIYMSLKNVVSNRKKFFVSIIIVNVVTTMMVAVVERIFCRGVW